MIIINLNELVRVIDAQNVIDHPSRLSRVSDNGEYVIN